MTKKVQSFAHSALMSVADVADALAVSNRTVRRMIAAGDIPIVRIGRAVRIRRVDVEALIGRNLTGGSL